MMSESSRYADGKALDRQLVTAIELDDARDDRAAERLAVPCSWCGGSGKAAYHVGWPCPACDGTGRVAAR